MEYDEDNGGRYGSAYNHDQLPQALVPTPFASQLISSEVGQVVADASKLHKKYTQLEHTLVGREVWE